MSATQGRQGWVGFATETTAGVPVTPADFIPFTESTLQGRHEPIANVAACGIRDEQSEGSREGQKKGEATFSVNMDPTNTGYLIFAAMGAQANNDETGGVYTHTFSRNNSNVPQTLSVTFDKSVANSREIYTYATVNSLEISYSTDNEFAIVSADMMSRFPVTTVSGTHTTTSGTLMSFKDAQLQLGTDLSDAEGSSQTKIRNFSMTINNNSEQYWRDGNNDVDFIAHKNFMVEGEIQMFFEDTTERDNFYNLTKQAAIITLTGDGIGVGLNEFLKIRIPKMRYSNADIEMGIDDLIGITLSFTAEYSSVDSKTVDVQLRNRKASY